ncbi:hypothetical protein B0H14DRAFT_2732705 [Mycena olivaceomarginata]|nr:hypothetical protein B0H14DRAFT_2732705 [Mycena olivaceomarginata]
MTSPPPPHPQLDISRPALGCAISESRLGYYDGCWSCCWSTQRLNCGNLGGLLAYHSHAGAVCATERLEDYDSNGAYTFPFPHPRSCSPASFPLNGLIFINPTALHIDTTLLRELLYTYLVLVPSLPSLLLMPLLCRVRFIFPFAPTSTRTV